MAVEYLPAAQSVQTFVSVLGLYFPAIQAVHGPPFALIYPTPQIQAVCPKDWVIVFAGQTLHAEASVAPIVTEYVLMPQSWHTTSPKTALYFPAVHCVHVPPFGPV